MWQRLACNQNLETAVESAGSTAVTRTSLDSARPTYAQVFANGEFRALWLAQLLSVAGDQLARVAMTVLVYDRTHSALWTALTYAVTLLPWVVGGLALSGIPGRLPEALRHLEEADRLSPDPEREQVIAHLRAKQQ